MEKVLRSRKDYESGEYDISSPASLKDTELSNVVYFVSRNEFILTLLLIMNTVLRIFLYLMFVSLFIRIDTNAPAKILPRVSLSDFNASLLSSGVIFLIGIVASILIARVLKEARGSFSTRHKQLLKVSEAYSWVRGTDSKYILSVDWNSFKQSQGTYFVSARLASAEQESKIVITNYRDFTIAYKYDTECKKPLLDFNKGILVYNILPNPNGVSGDTLGNWSKLAEVKKCKLAVKSDK